MQPCIAIVLFPAKGKRSST